MAWLKNNEESYDCGKDKNGKEIRLTAFPGVADGVVDPTRSWGGMPHCITGYFAAKLGVGRICLIVANVGHEAREVAALQEWRRIGPSSWYKDTLDDMASVFTDY